MPIQAVPWLHISPGRVSYTGRRPSAVSAKISAPEPSLRNPVSAIPDRLACLVCPRIFWLPQPSLRTLSIPAGPETSPRQGTNTSPIQYKAIDQGVGCHNGGLFLFSPSRRPTADGGIRSPSLGPAPTGDPDASQTEATFSFPSSREPGPRKHKTSNTHILPQGGGHAPPHR